MIAVKQLGYLVFEVSDLAAWEDFGTKILGLQLVDQRGDTGFSLRMDGYHQRFFIERGPADDLVALGWEVEGPAELEEFVGRFEDAGHSVTQGTADEAARRNVEALIRVNDPAGNPNEIFYGPKEATEPFVSEVVRSGFVATRRCSGSSSATTSVVSTLDTRSTSPSCMPTRGITHSLSEAGSSSAFTTSWSR
ncbi:MAG: VOC family protein, partial [Deltaproteobacteria bacterium]|nr:VOC family protein [Deltaproteobacteria bacterium]